MKHFQSNPFKYRRARKTKRIATRLRMARHGFPVIERTWVVVFDRLVDKLCRRIRVKRTREPKGERYFEIKERRRYPNAPF